MCGSLPTWFQVFLCSLIWWPPLQSTPTSKLSLPAEQDIIESQATSQAQRSTEHLAPDLGHFGIPGFLTTLFAGESIITFPASLLRLRFWLGFFPFEWIRPLWKEFSTDLLEYPIHEAIPELNMLSAY